MLHSGASFKLHSGFINTLCLGLDYTFLRSSTDVHIRWIGHSQLACGCVCGRQWMSISICWVHCASTGFVSSPLATWTRTRGSRKWMTFPFVKLSGLHYTPGDIKSKMFATSTSTMHLQQKISWLKYEFTCRSLRKKQNVWFWTRHFPVLIYFLPVVSCVTSCLCFSWLVDWPSCASPVISTCYSLTH